MDESEKGQVFGLASFFVSIFHAVIPFFGWGSVFMRFFGHKSAIPLICHKIDNYLNFFS